MKILDVLWWLIMECRTVAGDLTKLQQGMIRFVFSPILSLDHVLLAYSWNLCNFYINSMSLFSSFSFKYKFGLLTITFKDVMWFVLGTWEIYVIKKGHTSRHSCWIRRGKFPIRMWFWIYDSKMKFTDTFFSLLLDRICRTQSQLLKDVGLI